MTSGKSVKTALLLELDISVSLTFLSVTPKPVARMSEYRHFFFPLRKAHPTLTYQPGDSFDVFCPNRAEEVEDMLHRLGLNDQRNYAVHICLSKDTKKKGKTSLVKYCTIFFFFSKPVRRSKSLHCGNDKGLFTLCLRCSGSFPHSQGHFSAVPAHVVPGDQERPQEGTVCSHTAAQLGLNQTQAAEFSH